MASKKNIAFPEGNKLFAGDLVLIWMKETLIWFNLQRDGTRNGLRNTKDTFAECLQQQMPVLHQSIIFFKAGLSSSYDAGQNIKKMYLMCQIPINMLEQHAIPNSSSSKMN